MKASVSLERQGIRKKGKDREIQPTEPVAK